MKSWHAATATIVVAACCAGVWGFQRTADFGFGNDDSPTNVKSEFYWSRLAYSSRMSSAREARSSEGRWKYTELAVSARRSTFTIPTVTRSSLKCSMPATPCIFHRRRVRS